MTTSSGESRMISTLPMVCVFVLVSEREEDASPPLGSAAHITERAAPGNAA